MSQHMINADDKAVNKLDKKWFYEHLKSFSNPSLPIYIDMTLDKNNLRYRIHFCWENKRHNGKFNPIMSAQLLDITKQGLKRYVTKDLMWDCQKEDTTTAYKLYKFLNRWIEDAIRKYECLINNIVEDCDECGFCERSIE